MPQLDFTIVFSQIFWLFIIFTSFYTVLIHFFLPKFLISIKSRKKIAELNTLKALKIQENLVNKNALIQNELVRSLALIRNTIDNCWSSTMKSKKTSDLVLIDEKLGLMALNTTKYCNPELLKFIYLYPRLLNLKSN